MVPVRKPGRPLSACPHPRDSPCGCGSVTAAIPRRQTCHCGTSTPALSESRPPTSSSSSDASSPKQFTFKVASHKVGKPAKPSSSRKQSFDPANFERMDMSQVNVMPFEQRSHIVSVPMINGYGLPGPPQMYGFSPQYPNFPTQFNPLSIQMPPHINGVPQNIANGYSNGIATNGGLEHPLEGPLATPTGLGIQDLDKFTKGTSMTKVEAMGEEDSANSKGGSCCAPPAPPPQPPRSNGPSCCQPPKSHSHTLSAASDSETPKAPVASCCSSKPAQKQAKRESISNGASSHTTPQPSPLMIPHNVMPFGQPMYQYPQTTVFTYPPTYGSFHNPLQPQAWRQSIQANSHSQQHIPLPPGTLSFNTPPVPESLNTVHTCSCGDTCQCIGCAAHPYNDATQDYVRSAWASMSLDRQPNEIYTNGQSATNGIENSTVQPQPTETVASPTAQTPSSSTSANGDEQSLSAADFFFVNYPFTADGCGGDTQSCPCGDDCQCLGCTIHRQPVPTTGGCCGEKDTCDCGDDCQCVGCEFHGNA
jgi:hypothetical protein